MAETAPDTQAPCPFPEQRFVPNDGWRRGTVRRVPPEHLARLTRGFDAGEYLRNRQRELDAKPSRFEVAMRIIAVVIAVLGLVAVWQLEDHPEWASAILRSFGL